MNTKKLVPLLIGLLIGIALLAVACQGGEETAAKEAEPSTSSDTTPESTDTPEPAASEEIPDSSTSTDPLLIAALSELEGIVEMKQASEDSFYEADPTLVLEVNGQVQTGDDGKVRLDLSSGTIVRVSPSSLFTLVSNEKEEEGLVTKLKLELGRIFIILNGGSMEVETPSGVASVLGSYLKIEYNTGDESDPDDDTLELTCLEGDCSIVTPTGETINFTDGQKIVIHKDPNTGEWVVEEGPMTTDDFLEWLENNPEAKALVDAALTAQGGSTNGGGGGCLGLLHPQNGSDFFTFGPVDFQWEAQSGAASYVLSFTYPTGQVIQFSTTDTNMTRYIESMPPGGDYTWDVTAYDGNGNAICTAESLEFSKADTQQWLEEQKKKQKGGGEEPQPTEIPQ